MNAAARFNSVAHAAIVLAILAFCFADGRPFLAVIAAPIVLAGWMCGRQPWPKPPLALPRLLVNILVFAAIFNAALRASGVRGGGQPIVSHLGEFLIYVQLIKLFDRRAIRDDSQMLTLSIFIVIAAMLTSNTLAVGLFLLAYTPLGVFAAMLYQLRAGQQAVTPDPVTAPAAEFHGLRFNRHFARIGVLSIAVATVFAAVIFVFTPRGLGMGALGRFGETRAAVTGFSDDITLGRAMNISQSDRPVLDLIVEDSQGRNVGAEGRVFYLRGYTGDEYSGQTWVHSTRQNNRTLKLLPDNFRTLPEIGNSSALSTHFTQHITLRPPVATGRYILSMWRPLRIQTEHTDIVDIEFNLGDGTMRWAAQGAGGWRTASGAPVRYTVISSSTDTDSQYIPTQPLGFQSGRVHELAMSILSERRLSLEGASVERGRTRQIVSAFRDYLQDNCTYTLDIWAPPEDQDPLETFLFEKKVGHCQYFASAFVAMCQSVGIHARVVGGLVAAEFNSLTGGYIVRSANAHAWAEVHLGGGVWEDFDATPPAQLAAQHQGAQGWFDAIRRWWDTIEFSWNRSIVSFDASSQTSAVGNSIDLSGLRDRFNRLSERLVSAIRGGDRDGSGFRLPAWVFYIVPILMIVATAALVAGRFGRGALSRWIRRLRDRPRDPELRDLLASASFYPQALRELHRAGPRWAKPESVPPLDHARSLEPEHPRTAAALSRIADLFYRVRFARRPFGESDRTAAAAALADLRAAIRAEHDGRAD